MKTNYDKVLDVFFNNPAERFYVREIARLTKLNPNTILNITEQLVKEDLIKREKKKHIVEFFANTGKKFRKLKRIYNFSKIFINELIDVLDKKFSPDAISVIGSYSRGEDIEDSDIDIVVISKKEYENISVEKYEKELNRKIHLIVVNYNKMSDEFYTNLINGIILRGYIKKK